MPAITDDTIALIASRQKAKEQANAQKKTGTITKVLVVAGLGITIFGIIPALRGTNAKRAWEESGEDE